MKNGTPPYLNKFCFLDHFSDTEKAETFINAVYTQFQNIYKENRKTKSLPYPYTGFYVVAQDGVANPEETEVFYCAVIEHAFPFRPDYDQQHAPDYLKTWKEKEKREHESRINAGSSKRV